MGGRHGSQAIYLVSNLSRGELRRIGQHRLNNRSVPPGTDPHHPTIAADCNMVIHTVGFKKKDPVAALACYLEEWADLGFVVIPVVDGIAPKAKQATVDRLAKREKSRAKAIQNRQLLQVQTKRLEEDALTSDERKALTKKCKDLGAAVRRAETQAEKVVPCDFAHQLR